MEDFIAKHGESGNGVLSGWDRVLFRGNSRMLCVERGMMHFLWRMGVLLKDFGAYAEATTRRLKDASLRAAERYERPVEYLSSSNVRKEDVAREILREHPVDSGLVCVLKCVEPCMSYDVHRNPLTKKLELRRRQRQCLHLYHYFIDPTFGFMNARIQTWFPFTIHVCLNGREWLARKMDAAGLRYERADNCFPWIESFPRAQKLMDGLLKVNWPRSIRNSPGER